MAPRSPASAAFVPAPPRGGPAGLRAQGTFVRPLEAASRCALRARRADGAAGAAALFRSAGGEERYAGWAAEMFSAPPPTQTIGPAPLGPKDYSTVTKAFWANDMDLSVGELSVVRRSTLSVAHDMVEVQLDVRGTPWANGHQVPGQVVQLTRKGQRGMYTIASPPGWRDTISVVFCPKEDPVRLRKARVGDTIAASRVMGEGLDVAGLSSLRVLHLFCDTAQGFAAARSLLDWGDFRASTGTGTNRTTSIIVYYAMDSPSSLPCSSKISDWAMYGINVIPIVRQSLYTYLAAGGVRSIGGRSAGALACIGRLQDAERVFSSLAMAGVKRDAFHMYTDRTISNHVKEFLDADKFEMGSANDAFDDWAEAGGGNQGGWTEEDSTETSPGSKPFDMTEDVFQFLQRRYVEEQIWRRWVGVRDSMKAEFEKKWDQKKPQSRDARRNAEEEAAKSQAWASWFATNKDTWNAGQWEDVSWNSYWNGWKNEQSKWGSTWAEKTASNPWGSGSSASTGWNQNDSQEFWNAAGGGGGGGGGGANYDRYSDRYSGGSGSWGSSSTRREEAGYKYTHKDTGGGGSSSYTSGSSRSRQQDAWSGWGRQQQSRSYGGGGGGWGGNGGGGGGRTNGFAKGMDLYRILGIDSSASARDVKSAYRKAAKANHPDVGGDTEKMKEVVIAYMTLRDSSKRQQYDRNGI